MQRPFWLFVMVVGCSPIDCAPLGNEPCCVGDQCPFGEPGVGSKTGMCVRCGHLGEPCCPANPCYPMLTCVVREDPWSGRIYICEPPQSPRDASVDAPIEDALTPDAETDGP